MTALPSNRSKGFKFRGVLGAWINDLSSQARVEQWPSMVLDETLERDIVDYFQCMKESNWEYIVLFGLLASHSYTPDFKTTASPERMRAAHRILEAAHERGIKLLQGLGLYSWGYDEIIRTNQAVQGTNPHAMCGSKDASHRVMEQLIDYLLSEFAFDGFQFESADRGRCSCERCKRLSDSEYHLELNRRTAEYVRSKWPKLTIEVYSPIRRSTKDDWLIWAEPAKLFDVFCDDYEFVDRFGCDFRREFISQFQCTYATRSGIFLYPPQRWDRLRWFIPVIDRRATHYRRLKADGGGGVMIDGTPIINPAEEASLRCAGKLAVDPSRSVGAVLRETMEEMFRPSGDAVTRQLADIFWSAEKAYWCNAHFLDGSGELQLDPLLGTVGGPPVYLESRMYWHDLWQYQFAIKDIQRRFSMIQKDLGDQARAARVVQCLNAVLKDVTNTMEGRMLPYPVTATAPDTWTTKEIW